MLNECFNNPEQVIIIVISFIHDWNYSTLVLVYVHVRVHCILR